jgi:hypothetical protein
MIVLNETTPKAAAKLKLLFNKLDNEASLLNKISRLAAVLDVIKFCKKLWSHFLGRHDTQPNDT